MASVTKLTKPQSKVKAVLQVAAYCRVSTNSDEQEDSLANQQDHFKSYIQQQPNWQLHQIYYDNGISGTKAQNRPGLQALLKDCQNGQVDLVLTKSISRFSRNTTDCLRIIRQLKQLDIPVIFEKENINTGSMDSELILSVLGSLAQDESQSIAHNVRLGYQQRASNGVFHYSLPPYGYQKDANRDLIIDPIERKVVLRIFNWTIEGKSPDQIAQTLNEQAISTKRNGKWHDSTIRGILQNTVYLGTTEFQKTFTDDEYHRHPNQGEQGKIIIEEHHPAIIDQATFTQVQKIIMLKRKFYPQAKAKPQRHTFSRKIYCGNCQKLFKRQSRSGKVCWGCQTHIKSAKDCPVKSIREDALHLAFCTMVNKLIFSQKFLLEPLVEQLQADQNQEQAAKLSQVETELKEAKDKQDNLQQLRKQELIEKDFFTKQDAELEQEIANLQSEIERLKQLLGGQNSKLPLTHELLKLCQRSNYLTAFNAELFEQIIESITVDQDHNLTFHLKCGLNLTEGSKHHVKP